VSDISQWYNTAAGNNAQSVPDAAVEGVTTIADLNNCQRELQAGTRRYYETVEWRAWGYSIASTGTDSVTFTSGVPLYVVGSRVRITDTPAGVLYGTITNNAAQTITIAVDAGASLTEVTLLESGSDPKGNSAGNNLAVPAAADNVALLDAIGQVTDSTIPIAELTKGIVPAGAVMAFAMETEPTGWVECNGAEVSRTVTYDVLFAAIGTAFGTGDGSTTFDLPDMRGQFARGWDHTRGLDPNDDTRTESGTGGATGDSVGSIQTDEFKSHTHAINSLGTTGANLNTLMFDQTSGNTDGVAIATGGDETRPTNIYLMYCIKT
jgi:microcystin-dependent protein